MPVVLLAEIPVKKGSESTFEDVFAELTANVRQHEDGCFLYQLCKAQDGKYTVVEFYKDMDAVAAHGKTAYFKACGKRMAACMGGKPKVQMLNTLGDVASKL